MKIFFVFSTYRLRLELHSQDYVRTAILLILVLILALIINQDLSVDRTKYINRLTYCDFVEARTDQEKDRLAHLMAYGTDPTKMALEAAQRSPTPPPPPELDRFDECT